MNRPPAFSKWLVFLLSAFLVLRCLFWFAAYPNPDEAYYWLWGQRPELSYFDHPPLLAWIQGIFASLLGSSLFVLRLPNLLSNIAFIWIYFRFLKLIYQKTETKPQITTQLAVLVLCLLSSPLYFFFLAFAWHDHLMITFALASSYAFVRFLQTDKSRSLYGAALLLGLAGLSKYNAVFMGLGFAALVILNKKNWKYLLDKRIYIALGILALTFSPVIIWNLGHDLQSFRYHLIDRTGFVHGQFELRWNSLRNFIFTSFLTCSPFLWIAWGSGFFNRFSSKNDGKTGIPATTQRIQHLAFWVFLISTLNFAVLSLFSLSLYYWNICAYLLIFVFTPAFYFSRQGEFRFKNLFIAQQIFGLIFAAGFVFHSTVFPLTALVQKGGDPDSSMLFGWNEVSLQVQKDLRQLGPNPLLITTDYRSASGLAFQLKRKDVYSISDRIDQFKFWFHPEEHRNKNAVILADDWHPLPNELRARFKTISEPVRIPVVRYGVWIKDYFVFQGFEFRN